jgi:peptidoglycan/LPS O-acetylase OafA/YrhL
MGEGAKPARVEILDPLRGLAALSVSWFHFTNGSSYVSTGWLRASGTYGWLGVEAFFVISGFVIPYSLLGGGYEPRRHFGRFLLKRLTRLEPPYLLSIVLVIALAYLSARTPGFAGSPPDYSAPQLLLHLGYLNTFFGYRWLNPVYWTLGIEFQYYLFVALIFPFLTTERRVVRVAALAAMLAAALLVRTEMLVFHFLGLFALGMVAFQHHAGLLRRRTFLAAVLVATVVTAFSLGTAHALVGGTTALVIAFVPMPRRSVMRVLVLLGGISYSMYLLHTTIGGRVINLASRWGAGLPRELLALASAVAVTIVASLIFNRLVEWPAQRLSLRIRYSAPKQLQRVRA